MVVLTILARIINFKLLWANTRAGVQALEESVCGSDVARCLSITPVVQRRLRLVLPLQLHPFSFLLMPQDRLDVFSIKGTSLIRDTIGGPFDREVFVVGTLHPVRG